MVLDDLEEGVVYKTKVKGMRGWQYVKLRRFKKLRPKFSDQEMFTLHSGPPHYTYKYTFFIPNAEEHDFYEASRPT
jgi:hypothetical protein